MDREARDQYLRDLREEYVLAGKNEKGRLLDEAGKRTGLARKVVVRIFPNAASCRRLIRALAVETHEDWIEATRYLDKDLLWEQEKSRPRLGEAA